MVSGVFWFRQDDFGDPAILFYLGLERFYAIKLLFFPQKRDQLYAQMFAVEVAFEVEQMGFQQYVALVECRALANIGNAVVGAPVFFHLYAHSVNAEFWLKAFA